MINNLFSTKRFFIALTSTASIATALSLAACQEYDNGISSSDIEAAVYEKQFVEKFGEPAENHQWGFDAAEAMFGLMSGPETRAVYKQEMDVPPSYMKTTTLFGTPENIQDNERKEVLEWFTNHQVKWTNTPTQYNISSGERTTQTENNSKVATYVGDDKAVWSQGNSLLKYDVNKCKVDCPFGTVGFFNGWIQHVARDPRKDEKAKDSLSVYSCDNMDYLCFHDFKTKTFGAHLNDFNAAYGYCNPAFDRDALCSSNWPGSADQNAILVTESDFNVCTYGCSAGSSTPHDKYYIVYLKGDGYEGWYMGMDFESWMPDAKDNEIVKADGICNDWIIKLSDVGNNVYNPARIMCEDLGGSFDTDFNDIVYDVKYQDRACLITMQAAGGTMPIKLTYGDYTLSKNNKSEIHDLFGVDVTTPVNVIPGETYHNPIVWCLGFNNRTDTYYGEEGTFNIDKTFSEAFDFSKINVYVQPNSKAEWVNITLLDKKSKIPCRICVPNTTKWPQELKDISKAYGNFTSWVKDPTVEFWNGTKNDGLLYTIPQ